MTDSQLTARAGNNFPPFLGMYNRLSETVSKLVVKEVVLVENPNNEPLMVSQFAAGVVLLNRTTSQVDAELHLEDADGNRALMLAVSILAAADASMASKIVYLNAGEKMVLKIVSVASILTGTGLWVSTGTTNPPTPFGAEADRQHTVLSDVTLAIPVRPGVISAPGDGLQLSVSNYSDDALTVDVIAETSDGDLLLKDDFALPSHRVTVIGIPKVSPPYRLVFSALPAKPVVVNTEYIVPLNRFDQQ